MSNQDDAPRDPAPTANLPVPYRERHDGWTAWRRREFIEGVADGLSPDDAARAIGMTARSANRLRRREPGFDTLWAAAARAAARRLAPVALQRALEGTVRRRWYHGRLLDEERVFDNRLLLAALAREDRLRAAGRLDDAKLDMVEADWEGALTRVSAGGPALAPRPDRKALEYDKHKVWREADGALFTNFPPPPGIAVVEHGRFGDRKYARELTDGERAALDRLERLDADRDRRRAERAREAWFTPED